MSEDAVSNGKPMSPPAEGAGVGETGTTRRKFIWGGMAGVSMATLGPWPIAHAGEELIVNKIAGKSGEYHEKLFGEAFEKKHKVKINWAISTNSAASYSRTRATRGNPGWDVFSSLTFQELYLGSREGLLMPLSETTIPNLKYVWPEVWGHTPREGAPFALQTLGLSYNPNFIEAPASWLDYWKAQARYGQRVKGHVAIVQPANLVCIVSLILGARAAGGDENNMEPLWTMLKELQPYVGYNAASAQNLTQDIASGGVWLVPEWTNQGLVNEQMNSPLKVAKLGGVAAGLALSSAIPVGTKRKELAEAFINFRLEPEMQREFLTAYHTSPAGDLGIDWPKEYSDRQYVTQEQVRTLVAIDPQVIADKRPDWTLKWQQIAGAG